MKISKFALMIQVTAICTAVFTLVFSSLYISFWQPALLSLAITSGTTCYHFSVRLLVGALVSDRFDYHCGWFRPRDFEAALYRKLRLKHWKTQMPTYDPGRFSLQHNSLDQVVRNMCQAEVVHEIIILFSFVPLLFSIMWDSFAVFLITSLLAACFDALFVMLQRFNRPRIVKILESQTRRSSR